MHKRQRRGRAALALLGAAGLFGALLSGCGSSGSDPTARIKGVNLSTNAGTSGVLVNGGAIGGDLNFGESSPYNYIGQGVSTFGFTPGNQPPSNPTLALTYPPSSNLQLNNNNSYTAYFIGRTDAQNLSVGKTNPAFLQTVVTGNKGAAAGYASGATYTDPPSGQANIRILNGAPDAGKVDVLVNGKPVFLAVAYPPFPVLVTSTDSSAPAVNPVTLYQAVPSGTLSVQVNAAGTATVLVPPTNVSAASGQAYTLVVTEPTITPTYGLYTSSDQP